MKTHDSLYKSSLDLSPGSPRSAIWETKSGGQMVETNGGAIATTDGTLAGSTVRYGVTIATGERFHALNRDRGPDYDVMFVPSGVRADPAGVPAYRCADRRGSDRIGAVADISQRAGEVVGTLVAAEPVTAEWLRVLVEIRSSQEIVPGETKTIAGTEHTAGAAPLLVVTSCRLTAAWINTDYRPAEAGGAG